MKIWMTFKVIGHIVILIGPLPYDFNECVTRAGPARNDFVRHVLHNPNNPKLFGREPTVDEITVTCIQSDKNPVDPKHFMILRHKS